jgi:hypothetical protein
MTPLRLTGLAAVLVSAGAGWGWAAFQSPEPEVEVAPEQTWSLPSADPHGGGDLAAARQRLQATPPFGGEEAGGDKGGAGSGSGAKGEAGAYRLPSLQFLGIVQRSGRRVALFMNEAGEVLRRRAGDDLPDGKVLVRVGTDRIWVQDETGGERLQPLYAPDEGN